MARVIDLNAEFARLAMLRGPTLTTVAERRDAICRLLPYRDRHLRRQVLGQGRLRAASQGRGDGADPRRRTTLHLITADGREKLELTAGMLAAVPQNAWHQFEAPEGVSLITATP